jgi:dipeptidyl-peptidase-4
MKKTSALVLLLLTATVTTSAQKIYWGDSVPKGWNGKWPARLLTVPEKTNFERTAMTMDVIEFIDALRWNSDKVHVFSVYTSPLRKICPAIVLASPRVTTPEEAAKSGKTVVYLQGNIHPYEMEGKESLLILAREILLGKLTPLLDRLIIIICPNFNVDGNDMVSFGEGTPHLVGSGNNSQNLNLNRDAVRVDTVEVQGLYRTIFNRWDPTLIFDAHLMGRVQHGYANGYIHSTVPAASPEPRDYVFDKLFPAVREATRKNFGLEVFTHSGTDNTWPPTIWGPGEAIWSNEAKFVANAYGLRNRMSILAETPGHESFERRIYAHVALMTEVLRYAAAHGQEMKEVCRRADAAVVEAVRTKAESGELRNFVAGKYESYGKIDILMYRERNANELIPGTSVRGKMATHMLGEPELVKGVEFMAKAVGTASATVPRGYLIPAELDFIAEKLRTHNVKVEVLTKPIKVSGEEFVIDKIGQGRGDGYAMIKLDGGFAKSPVKEFPAGTFRVDMAQPMANVAFYMLEPQAADGFVGSGVFDAVFKSLGAGTRSIVYPVYKYFKVLE